VEYLTASNDAESDQAYLKIAFIVSSDGRSIRSYHDERNHRDSV